MEMTITELKCNRADTEEYHKHIHELFCELVDAEPKLKEHRDFVEQNVFGMGERSFWWLWKLMLEELPENPKLLEIGVFKAATMSLWKMLRPDGDCYGVTPLDGRGTGWTEDDYAAHIVNIHTRFALDQPVLNIGSSHDEQIVELTADESPYDVVYIDGDHSYAGALADLSNYAPMVKSGGYLVMDDAACQTKQPFGYFQGIAEVCQALEEWESVQTDFEFQFNVVHLMIYKRK